MYLYIQQYLNIAVYTYKFIWESAGASCDAIRAWVYYFYEVLHRFDDDDDDDDDDSDDDDDDGDGDDGDVDDSADDAEEDADDDDVEDAGD